MIDRYGDLWYNSGRLKKGEGMKVYKLLRIKDGKLYPLFINRKAETKMVLS